MTELAVAVLAVAATVYGTSATAKLRSDKSYQAFKAGLAETMLIPRRRLSLAAGALVVAEAVVAILSGAGALSAAFRHAPGAIAEAPLAGGALLTSLLAGGIWVVLRRGTIARCACFGPGVARELGRALLVRNLLLLTMVLAGLIGSSVWQSQASVAEVAVAAAAGVVAGLLLVRFDDLVALFMPIPASPGGSR